jgi:hypothetical protein
MTSYFKNIIVLILVSVVSPAFAQNVTVSAKLDTGAMLIGDHIGMTISFTGPAKAQVLWPFIPDTILGNIQVIGRGKIDTVISADKKTATFRQFLNITCFDSGFYNIPSIPLRYRNLPDTSQLVALTDPMMLAVHTVPVDTTQAIKPIKGVMKIPVSFREMLPWILAGLLLVAIILVLIWYYRKRKKNEPVFRLKPRVVLTAREKALQELEKLRVKKLWQSGKLKEYHTELTDILRIFIEEHYQVPAMEQTTSEILESLSGPDLLDRDPLETLSQLLTLADMVKFAKAHPVASENEKSLESGISFINAGKKRSAEPEQSLNTETKTT